MAKIVYSEEKVQAIFLGYGTSELTVLFKQTLKCENVKILPYTYNVVIT